MDAYPALLRISRSDFEESTIYSVDAAVQFEDAKDKSEGYMATLGMYHELHCLVGQLQAHRASLPLLILCTMHRIIPLTWIHRPYYSSMAKRLLTERRGIGYDQEIHSLELLCQA